MNKKRKNKKTEEKNEIKDSKNLFNDIKELLKTYSLDNEEVLDYEGETNLVDIKFNISNVFSNK